MSDPSAWERLPDEAVIWRRVPPAEQLPPDSTTGEITPKGSAFRTKGTDDGVSIGVAAQYLAAGLGPEAMLEPDECDESWGVLEISVREVRAEGLEVGLDPDDHSHGLVIPPPPGAKARRISKSARWALHPRPIRNEPH